MLRSQAKEIATVSRRPPQPELAYMNSSSNRSSRRIYCALGNGGWRRLYYSPRIVGQVFRGTLWVRRIVNPPAPLARARRYRGGSPPLVAACRYAGLGKLRAGWGCPLGRAQLAGFQPAGPRGCPFHPVPRTHLTPRFLGATRRRSWPWLQRPGWERQDSRHTPPPAALHARLRQS